MQLFCSFLLQFYLLIIDHLYNIWRLMHWKLAWDNVWDNNMYVVSWLICYLVILEHKQNFLITFLFLFWVWIKQHIAIKIFTFSSSNLRKSFFIKFHDNQCVKSIQRFSFDQLSNSKISECKTRAKLTGSTPVKYNIY